MRWVVVETGVPDHAQGHRLDLGGRADESQGGIGGVLATVHEITAKIVGQRRGTVLRELASAVEARSAEQACINAAAKLGLIQP